MNLIVIFTCFIALITLSHTTDTDNPGKCGGNYTVDGAEITSPNYPDDYPPGQWCEYLISAPEGMSVTVVMEFLETESTHDYLKIYNGPKNRSESLGTFYGTYISRRRMEAGNKVFMQFKSDLTYNYRGFKLYYHFRPQFNYNADGDGAYSESSGDITSPHYPHYYPHRISCDYRITAPEGSAIVIETENFESESSFDCLRIYNGRTNNSELLANFTGKMSGITTVQGGNIVFMRFNSDAVMVVLIELAGN